jgi:hypothetical protein
MQGSFSQAISGNIKSSEDFSSFYRIHFCCRMPLRITKAGMCGRTYAAFTALSIAKRLRHPIELSSHDLCVWHASCLVPSRNFTHCWAVDDEPAPAPADETDLAAAAALARSTASMQRSISCPPSKKSLTFPVSQPFRRSFTSLYGCRT